MRPAIYLEGSGVYLCLRTSSEHYITARQMHDNLFEYRGVQGESADPGDHRVHSHAGEYIPRPHRAEVIVARQAVRSGGVMVVDNPVYDLGSLVRPALSIPDFSTGL